MKFPAAIIVLLISIFSNVGHASDNDELLESVRIAHRASRQSIQQLTCNYLVQESFPKKIVMGSGKYARSFGVVSIKDGNEGISTADAVIRDGQYKLVGRHWQNDKIEYYAAIKSEVQYFSWGDVWQRMLIDHSSPDGERCNFDMVVDRISKNCRLSRVTISGRECILIVAEEKNKLGYTKILKMWHDIGNNYLVRKIESYDLSDPRDRNVAEITEFREFEPGIPLPVSCRVEVYRADKLTTSFVTTLNDIQVNQPVSDQVFVLPTIPKGTRLQDSIHGTIRDIGSDWKPIGPASPHVRTLTAPARAEQFGGEPTASEIWTFDRYLFYGSLAAFFLCIISLLFRRYRATRNSVESSD